MDILLLPTNELVYNLPELHDFIFNLFRNNPTNINKNNKLYCDIFTENTISWNRNEINISQPYKFTQEYSDNFKIGEGIIKLMDNINIFQVYIPLREQDHYLGTIYSKTVTSRDDQYYLRVIKSPEEFF